MRPGSQRVAGSYPPRSSDDPGRMEYQPLSNWGKEATRGLQPGVARGGFRSRRGMRRSKPENHLREKAPVELRAREVSESASFHCPPRHYGRLEQMLAPRAISYNCFLRKILCLEN